MSGIAAKADATIHRQVLEELKWDTRVDETEIGVEVDNGVVTLTGYVDSHAKRAAAEQAAHRVVGVLDVANDIKVRAADALGRTDTEIAQAARHVLDANILVPGERIQMTVSDGWVALPGQVDYWRQSEDAERSVLRVRGVLGVANELTVLPQPVATEAIRAAFERRLDRRAERESERIQVSVDDGVVTLAGWVRAWRERHAMRGAAGHAPRVRGIVDELRVDPTLREGTRDMADQGPWSPNSPGSVAVRRSTAMLTGTTRRGGGEMRPRRTQFTGGALFLDRVEAGRRLAEHLDAYRGQDVLVLGIPRGGVPVAAEVAKRLGAELDIVVARKLGAPTSKELAIGAVTANGGLFLNEDLLHELRVSDRYLNAIVASERAEAHRRQGWLRGARPKAPITGRFVIVVDDGLATGATMRAALRSVREDHPSRLIAALPIGSREGCEDLRAEADEVVCPLQPEPFFAVGLYYWNFSPTEDEEVQRLLAESYEHRPAAKGVLS